jgi:hypothetical protein
MGSFSSADYRPACVRRRRRFRVKQKDRPVFRLVDILWAILPIAPRGNPAASFDTTSAPPRDRAGSHVLSRGYRHQNATPISVVRRRLSGS